MINALDGELDTEGLTEDAELQPTDNQQTEDETSSNKETEPSEGKNFQHSLQLAREREKAEREARLKAEQEAAEIRSRLEEFEMQGMSETDALRVQLERERQEKEQYKQTLEVEETKKSYRSWLSEREADHPKTVAILRKQMEKDIYPVQGATPEAFEENFLSFAADIEEANTPSKPASSNPSYTDPDVNVDFTNMSPSEMRKYLPMSEKDR